eukprot:CAMPEP_0114993494 /NCGR_PEP_ID=MMETSP0216-20121206/12561_1 /TAXON_ID=223996 /ORGANISM="Protocruzia adherens, Strain Boccale" /LENGTH=251 /DNA_ID=CAMNT_0002357143 /DNA_START=166 /DNA_END=921 /DNA_ORIENTATION=-
MKIVTPSPILFVIISTLISLSTSHQQRLQHHLRGSGGEGGSNAEFGNYTHLYDSFIPYPEPGVAVSEVDKRMDLTLWVEESDYRLPGDRGVYLGNGSCRVNKRRMLEAHNEFRRRHNATDLIWSDPLALIAQGAANLLGENGCQSITSPTIGENMAWDMVLDEEAVVRKWYADHVSWDLEKQQPYAATNWYPFAQVVWKETKQLGCGRVCCDTAEAWICRYDPAASDHEGFDENVGPLAKEYDFSTVRPPP